MPYMQLCYKNECFGFRTFPLFTHDDWTSNIDSEQFQYPGRICRYLLRARCKFKLQKKNIDKDFFYSMQWIQSMDELGNKPAKAFCSSSVCALGWEWGLCIAMLTSVSKKDHIFGQGVFACVCIYFQRTKENLTGHKSTKTRRI